jgi:hypothetical protein
LFPVYPPNNCWEVEIHIKANNFSLARCNSDFMLTPVPGNYAANRFVSILIKLNRHRVTIEQQNTISTDCGIHYTISQGTVVKEQSSTAVKETCGH